MNIAFYQAIPEGLDDKIGWRINAYRDQRIYFCGVD